MQNRYSLVISPPDDIIDLVKSMKLRLAKEIGWFHSKNSLAHITINEFMASESQIQDIKKELTDICDGLKAVPVYFDKFDTYPNGAFFIAPDETSKKEIKKIMKHIHQSFRYEILFKNNEPHMTIARQLKPNKIEAAYRLFPNGIMLDFVCESVALRLFNPVIKQFEIIHRFEFNDNPKPTIEQGTLF